MADERTDFIRDIIDDDLRTGKHGGRVLTRFPPEPNGYLHIGHAKSICLNFGIAQQYGTRCNLRFDDTNPVKEDVEYVDSIQADIQWLGFSFGGVALYASDYFEEMYALCEDLIRDGKAYVCELTDEQIKEYRGTLTEPGRPSPWRDRPVEDSLARFRDMRGGALADGACVVRAKIDMASANMKMRDPLLYRIRHAHHHRTGDAWCIYPMYDYAHPISDAIEGITHSICTLEFENNRELYDWVVEHTRVSERHGFSRPQQIEFARLALDYTVMSKRKLLTLVVDHHVAGWDDPRMPTIAGMRRRGYSAEAIRAFAELVGVAKANSVVDIGKLEYCVRDDLNRTAPRVMGVVRPLKLTITSYGDDTVESFDAPYFPADVGKPGSRPLPFSRTLWIERDDFAQDPPADYQRLAPGRTVRLRHAYCVTCEDVVEQDGEVVEVRCRHLPDTIGKNPAGEKVWGVIHWVSAAHALDAEVRLYDRLFKDPRPEDAGGDFLGNLNPASLEVVAGAKLEASLAGAAPGSRWQLERVGYFAVDPVDSRPDALVLNRIVTLRDSWASKADAATAPAADAPREKSAKAKTRPPRRSKAEYRAEARVRDPALAAAYDRLQQVHGLAEGDADVLTGDAALVSFFDAAIDVAGAAPAAVARWMTNELSGVLGERPVTESPMRAAQFGRFVVMAESGTITRPVAKQLLEQLVARGGEPEALVAQLGLAAAADDGAIAAIVDEVLAGNAAKVEQYRGGKVGLLGFFVGQVVKASKGAADPQRVQELLKEKLS
ncbi:MAG: glutamine--tRNA ligase/YqeY domain fusion protein [Myxococcales bacterium]|nr:glutamine--tRNA ligase/YqeY domain fusion protein [Myxococcales bacterium]